MLDGERERERKCAHLCSQKLPRTELKVAVQTQEKSLEKSQNSSSREILHSSNPILPLSRERRLKVTQTMCGY